MSPSTPSTTGRLTIVTMSHPDARVRQGVGFALTHPYVERCWGAIVGPSGTMLLRRLPQLWAEREPAVVEVEEFARTLGLSGQGGERSIFHRTLDRLTNLHLAVWTDTGAAIGVYAKLPPIRWQRVARLPTATQRDHLRLLGDARSASTSTSHTAPDHRSLVETSTHRLGERTR